jgi:hypothetical protein
MVEIDAALARNVPEREVAATYGVTQSSVSRHRRHTGKRPHERAVGNALRKAPVLRMPVIRQRLRVLDELHSIYQDALDAQAQCTAPRDIALFLAQRRGVIDTIVAKYPQLAAAEDAHHALQALGDTPEEALAWLETEGLPALRAACGR